MTASIRIWSILLLAAALNLWAVESRGEDFRDGFPQILTMSPHGVNLQTGRFELRETDLTIGSLSLERRYGSEQENAVWSFATANATNNGDRRHPAFGIGYNLRGVQFHRTVNTFGGGQSPRLYFLVQGTQLEFASTQSGLINWGAETQGWRAYPQGSEYILLHKSGTRYRFAFHSALGNTPQSPRLLVDVVQPNGQRLDYVYGATAELLSVKSNLGYQINYQYSAPTNVITVCGYNLAVSYASPTQGCAASSLKVAYHFGPVGNSALQITSVTHVDGSVTTYQFADRYMTCATFPNSSTCRIVNEYWPLPGDVTVSLGEKADMVRRQTTATGEIWQYSYDLSQFAGDAPPLGPRDLLPGNERYTYSYMTDPQGRSTEIQYLFGTVKRVIAPTGQTLYQYNGTIPASVQFPEGNQLVFSQDLMLNNTEQKAIPNNRLLGETDIIASQEFPVATDFYIANATTVCTAASQVLCDKPIWRRDARGNQTDYTYDPTHGGTLTETLPAVTSPSGASVRPQRRTSYVQRTAMVRDMSGNIIATGPAIWLPASTSLCREGAASGNGCATLGDETVTNFEYGPTTGPNNLLLRGQVVDAGGLSLRTCYVYDAVGNRISETQPEGTSAAATCP